jgi:hypothetical protein
MQVQMVHQSFKDRVFVFAFVVETLVGMLCVILIPVVAYLSESGAFLALEIPAILVAVGAYCGALYWQAKRRRFELACIAALILGGIAITGWIIAF